MELATYMVSNIFRLKYCKILENRASKIGDLPF